MHVCVCCRCFFTPPLTVPSDQPRMYAFPWQCYPLAHQSSFVLSSPVASIVAMLDTLQPRLHPVDLVHLGGPARHHGRPRHVQVRSSSSSSGSGRRRPCVRPPLSITTRVVGDLVSAATVTTAAALTDIDNRLCLPRLLPLQVLRQGECLGTREDGLQARRGRGGRRGGLIAMLIWSQPIATIGFCEAGCASRRRRDCTDSAMIALSR